MPEQVRGLLATASNYDSEKVNMDVHPLVPAVGSDGCEASSADTAARPLSERPLVSVVIPAFNEEAVLESTLSEVCRYLRSLETFYRWELLVVNDGSTDRTGQVADTFACGCSGVRIIHHVRNRGLGHALRTGFQSSCGKYVVVLDCDLSYSPDHIGQLLTHIRRSHANIVVASPYAEGGRVSEVPWLRRTMSVWANRFLAALAKRNLSTYTGMMRIYDGEFIRAVSLKSRGQDISPEIIYKGMMLNAVIEEIPAHLDWRAQMALGARRSSSMRVVPHVCSTILTGFLFRPFMFFLLPGLVLLACSAYVNAWMVIHFWDAFQAVSDQPWIPSRASLAVAQAYQASPHTFLVGGLSFMLSIQLISLGLLSMQSKRYFEEMFHLASSLLRSLPESRMTMRLPEGKAPAEADPTDHSATHSPRCVLNKG